MTRNGPIVENPIVVPRSDKRLTPVAPERVQRLRERLIGILHELRKARALERIASPSRPPPTGFHAVVAKTACSLCRGHCCRNGDDDAFLDERTLARVRLANPAMTERGLARLYLARVPDAAYHDSCIFHGKHGCTLDRSMRADVCNTYFCGGLSAFLTSKAKPGPTIVIAGEGEKMRTSPVLMP